MLSGFIMKEARDVSIVQMQETVVNKQTENVVFGLYHQMLIKSLLRFGQVAAQVAAVLVVTVVNTKQVDQVVIMA